MLEYLGVKDVMICDKSELRLSIAKGLGFATCNISREDFIEKAAENWGKAYSIHGNTADIDIWIDAAGPESIIDTFMKRGKIDARFVMVAVNNNIRNLNLLDITFSSQSIIGSGGYRPEDVKDVMNIMKSSRWNIESIITDEYSIVNLDEALKRASDVEKSLNVIVHF